MTEYRILRVSGAGIAALMDLETQTAVAINDGWILQGAPFRDKITNCWCQSMTKAAVPAGQVRLKEPKR